MIVGGANTYSQPSIPMDSVSMDSTHCVLKIFEEKKISIKFQKAKFEFATFGNYLHSVYIVLGVISSLTMI